MVELLCAQPGCGKPWDDPVHSHRFICESGEAEEEEMTVAIAVRMRLPKGSPTTAATRVALEHVHSMTGYVSSHAEVIARHEARTVIPYPMMTAKPTEGCI
jgi:hypothetical protein